jgi:uncharacterized protein YbjT (DUF2867 family)
MRSIATIFAPVIVNPASVIGLPSAAVTTPAAPLINAGRVTWAMRVKGSARPATAAAPRTASVPLERTTTSGSSASSSAWTGSAHLVYVSIVGIDRLASWGYPKTKLQAEEIVASSGLPWTILRVTQFYDYCQANAQELSRFPVAPVPAGFTVQPVDSRELPR